MKKNLNPTSELFFVSCALGFEQELATEIMECWPFLKSLDGRPHAETLDLQVLSGGIELRAPLFLGLQLNFFLKTAHRILLRIKQFSTKDFPKLFNEAKKIELNSWLHDKKIYLEVAAQKSRLNNEKRISETLKSAWKEFQIIESKKDLSHNTQIIYVRIFEDHCSISLDTTGAHLHERGRLKNRGPAPVRETLAAFCLRKMRGPLSLVETRDIRLIDPMLGSGTFISEAHDQYQLNSQRVFQFQNWKKTAVVLKNPLWLKNYESFAEPFAGYMGLDSDPEMINIAKSNLAYISNLELKVQDLFQAKPTTSQEKKWLICNPPYGERLHVDFKLEELLEKLIQTYQPEKLGVLCSQSQYNSLNPKTKKNIVSFYVKNGGIDCVFLIWHHL